MVTPFDKAGTGEMDILVKAQPGYVVSVTSSDRICQLRSVDDECKQALSDFAKAYGTREGDMDSQDDSDPECPDLVDWPRQ